MNSNQDERVVEKIAKKKNNIFEELLPKIIHLRARFEDCQKHTMSIATCCMSINKSAQGLRVFLLLSLFNKLSLHLHLKFPTNLLDFVYYHRMDR